MTSSYVYNKDPFHFKFYRFLGDVTSSFLIGWDLRGVVRRWEFMSSEG